jgi:tungstate transport system substrate-binding protein
MRNKLKAILSIAILSVIMTLASYAKNDRLVTISTTIGPVDAGIIDVLENEFEKETGIQVRHVSAGTGAALETAKKGGIDLVVVHAKSLEEKFIKDGFGTDRIPLMYNDFVIVGPGSDPAGIKGMKNAADALKKIAGKKAPFVTRGDKSGTHVAEMVIWDKTGIKPEGAWYKVYEKGAEGNVSTLKYTDQNLSYTIIDRATVLSLKKGFKLEVLVENDDILLNYISLIPVNPSKIKRVNSDDALTFVKWLTSPEKGQKIIKNFGIDKYGSPMFFPNSREWVKANKSK